MNVVEIPRGIGKWGQFFACSLEALAATLRPPDTKWNEEQPGDENDWQDQIGEDADIGIRQVIKKLHRKEHHHQYGADGGDADAQEAHGVLAQVGQVFDLVPHQRCPFASDSLILSAPRNPVPLSKSPPSLGDAAS